MPTFKLLKLVESTKSIIKMLLSIGDNNSQYLNQMWASLDNIEYELHCREVPVFGKDRREIEKLINMYIKK